MSRSAKSIENEIKTLKTELKRLEDEYYKKDAEICKKIWKLSDALKGVCDHSEVEHIDSYNYHKNQDDSYFQCKICKKHVQPKTVTKYE